MKILYLHGLMSSNQSSKTDWLKQEHIVFNPSLNYKHNSEHIFSELDLLCEQNHFNLIIGSSMGGHLAFHLSNKHNIPSLLFNPSLEKNSIPKPDVVTVVNPTILHHIVLGEKDDVVIPAETIKYLEDHACNFVYSFENNGHRTPFNIFEKHFLKIKSSKP